MLEGIVCLACLEIMECWNRMDWLDGMGLLEWLGLVGIDRIVNMIAFVCFA